MSPVTISIIYFDYLKIIESESTVAIDFRYTCYFLKLEPFAFLQRLFVLYIKLSVQRIIT